MKRVSAVLLGCAALGTGLLGCHSQADYGEEYIHSGRYSAQGVYYDEDHCGRHWDNKMEEDFFYHFRNRYWGEPKGPEDCGDEYYRFAHRR